jgi:hypothetical protein
MDTATPSAASTDSQLVQVLDRYLHSLQCGNPPGSHDKELLAIGRSGGDLVIWNLPKIKAKLDELGLGW